ncbi:MAG: guanylate kinase [Clostridiales bacterium]|nr:guanylate kinase [Clostridiales bacterium]
MKNNGVLIVLSAPSGCGKGTILSTVLEQNDNLFYSISATTRAPREGEEDGKHYHFVSKDEFMQLIDRDEVLEYTTYCDNYYGTPRKAVEEQLAKGRDVILEIEVDGAMQIKNSYPNAVFVFILPPSIAELKRRLGKRGTESEEVIEGRLKEAVNEIAMAYKYDYIIVNDELEKAINTLNCVIGGEKQTVSRMINKIDEVLDNA